MDLNDRVKMQLGELVLQNLALSVQLEQAAARIAELETKPGDDAQKERPA